MYIPQSQNISGALGRSTTGALLSATHSWHKALESGVDVCAVFLDLSKAFDKVPHSLLLQKLESLNINLHLLNWIQDYLCNRSQYVVVNGESSTSALVVSGVSQGSVLGPLFFLIYINDIMEVCLSDGCMLLYADDILLHRQVRSVSDYLLIQQDIDALQDWLKYNYLDLNSTKCDHLQETNFTTACHLSEHLWSSSGTRHCI